MTFGRLLVRNLLYHWRGNLAVLLGVAVGAAVLTGALLVGDCLRGSLRVLALDQLGWVEDAMVAGRFFRAALADQLAAERAAPAILLQGSAAVPIKNEKKTEVRTIGKVTILGVDRRFWPEGEVPESWDANPAEVILNATLAEALKVMVGDSITLNVQKADAIPRESLLGKRKVEDVLQSLVVKVRAIRPDAGMARFSLKPSPEPVRNAFVPLGFLQEKLELAGRANAVLVAGARQPLQQELAKLLTLDDWNLRLRTPEDRARSFVRYLDRNNRGGPLKRFKWEGRVPEELAKRANKKGELAVEDVIDFYREERRYLSLESRQMFLEPAVVAAVEKIADLPKGIGNPPPRSQYYYAPTLVYLADTISDGRNEVPYAVVGAIDTWAPPPLGPFSVLKADFHLDTDEIVLASWPRSPLKTEPGQRISITYYSADDHGQLHKKSVSLRLKEIIPLKGVLDDPDLTPEFPGITDKLDMGNWEKPPFPYNPKRVKPADEEYWRRYRTTPQAYVSLATGQKLWGSRFGQLTSIRIAPANDIQPVTADDFTTGLLRQLDPKQGGFVFQQVRKQALRAAGGSTDFAMLFLAFSFFLIVAALMLVGLLFRLNLDRRAAEIGLLLAVGWRRRSVRWLLLAEGFVLAILGGAIGLLAAGLYARGLLEFLSRSWPQEGGRLTFLGYHSEPLSFLIGYVAALVVSILTIFWAVRALARIALKSLLLGETVSSVRVGESRSRWSMRLAIVFGLGAVGSLAAAFVAGGREAQAMSFFGSGACLLIALLAGTWAGMREGKRKKEKGKSGKSASIPFSFFLFPFSFFSMVRLGIRNASRHPVRSLLTIGLMASAMFLVVAVQSFHREAGEGFLDKDGGSGGFSLIVESDLPIFQDLNRSENRDQVFFPDKVPPVLHEAKFFPFRVRPGDDASCLNLYQPLRPRLLGVSEELIRRGGFHFAPVLHTSQKTVNNPWLLLEGTSNDGIIPVFADANTAQWILHVKLGDALELPDGSGRPRKLRIVGLLQESIFQGELLMADSYFKEMFPRQEGFGFFLVECPHENWDEIKSALETAPGLPGLFVTTTTSKLQGYLDVENTYLLTFQALGGIGLLLGALGLAVVLLRSVWERRGELALLRALGFRRLTLGWLVLAENGFLLMLGLGVGALSALVAVSPHLLGSGSRILWGQLLCLLALVLAVGLGAAALAVMASLRAPLLTALRRE